jgi:hypothetical protein
MHTQASPFGQCLLGQAGRLSMLTEQVASDYTAARDQNGNSWAECL